MHEIINTDVLIIGGGASGLAAAITLKQINPQLNVTIAERLSRTGKKILATGNGRCNLGNINISNEYYHGSVKNYMDIIESTPHTDDFFKSLGLYCVNDDMGRMYPYSNTATSVLTVLRNKLSEYNVTEICDFNAQIIEKCKNKFKVHNENTYIIANKLLITAGGCAGNTAFGTDGSMLKLLKQLGHKITPLYPAIAPLNVKNDELKGLKGVRVKGIASAYSDGKKIASEKGEIQFNECSLSGICIFNLSYLYAIYGNHLKISLDLCPDKNYSDITDILYELRKINKDNILEHYLIGLFNKNIAAYIIKKAEKKQTDKIYSITNQDIKKIASLIKSLEFSVTDQSDWKNAQVTYGGISGESVDSNLQSTVMKNIYFAGEILDVDGLCGGYNLTWAWSSAIYAARKIAESFGGKNGKN